MAGLIPCLKAFPPSRQIVRQAFSAALVVSALAVCLCGDWKAVGNSNALSSLLGEVAAACSDPDTQWVLFACVGIWFLAFAVLRGRLATRGRTGATWSAALQGGIWLVGLVAVAALAYALYYAQAVKSTSALTLFGAAIVGQGAAVWAGREGTSPKLVRGTVVCVLIVLLLGAAVWRAPTGYVFEYRGQARWSGHWDNPNMAGALMGVGVVLAIGLLVQSRPCAECGTSNLEL